MLRVLLPLEYRVLLGKLVLSRLVRVLQDHETGSHLGAVSGKESDW